MADTTASSLTCQAGGKNGSSSPGPKQGRLFGENAADLPRIVETVIDRLWAGNRKLAACDLGVAEKTLANWLAPNSDRQVPTDALLKLIDLGGTELLDYLCSLAGGCFVRLPETSANHPSMAAVQAFQSDSAALTAALAKLPDGDREDARLRCRIVTREVLAFERGIR